MWIRTINGCKFFKVEYTQQGILYPTKEITIRETIKPNKLFYIDLNGNIIHAENNKEELKLFIFKLIDKIYASKEN